MRIDVATGTHRTKLLSSALAVLNAAAAAADKRVHHFKFRAKFIGDCDWSHLSLADIYTSKWELMTRFIRDDLKNQVLFAASKEKPHLDLIFCALSF